ncbi:MAG: thioredoxin fold domain-containing protein [Bacteroidota bacterium]
MSRFIIIVFFILFTRGLSAQYTVSPSPVKWYDIEEAFELNKKDPRPILIDVYSDWCSWCKFMMKTTFANKGIASYINKHFYPVRFNAESMDTIEFQGKKYFNRKIGRKPTHDLASILLEGKLSYPSIVYFDRSGKKTIVPGYKEPKDIEPTLVYQVESLSKYVSLSEFTANFMFTFPTAFEKDHSIFKIPTINKPDTLGKPNWIKPEKINIQNKKKRKPTIVFFQTDWCISCKVMEKTTFGDQDISMLMNENFNVVKIDAVSQDAITFFGKQYLGTGKTNPHQLTQSLLQNNFQLPAVVFFDESGKSLIRLNGYLNIQNLKPLIHFFFEKKYQDISYNEYLKSLKTSIVTTKTSMN